MHFSTDYVFDGAKRGPYFENDRPNPLSAYGRSKFEGEQAIRASGVPHLILRTSWVYGKRGRNFLVTMLSLFEEKPQLRIVDDQIGAPTWSRWIAQATAEVLAQCLVGRRSSRGARRHLSPDRRRLDQLVRFRRGNPRAALWSRLLGKGRSSLPIPTSGYPLPARRPSNSVLSTEQIAEGVRNSASRLARAAPTVLRGDGRLSVEPGPDA